MGQKLSIDAWWFIERAYGRGVGPFMASALLSSPHIFCRVAGLTTSTKEDAVDELSNFASLYDSQESSLGTLCFACTTPRPREYQ